MKKFIRHRESRKDLGRAPAFDRRKKHSIQEVLIANFSRAKESARILEELLQADHARASGMMKKIRFKVYDLEKHLSSIMDRTFDPSLYVILDEQYLRPAHLEKDLHTMIVNRVTMVQLRVSTMNDRMLLRNAQRISEILRDTGVTFIVNNRVDIALLCRAHGVHLGQRDVTISAARMMLGEHRIVGVSARTRAQVLKAQRNGADYIGVGAIFQTRTKPDARVIGLPKFKKLCQITHVPIIGIGGITDRNYRSVLRAGASGIAVSSYVFKGPLRRRIRSLTGKRR